MRASILAGLLAFTVSACGKPAGPDAYTGASGTPRDPCAVSPRSPDEVE